MRTMKASSDLPLAGAQCAHICILRRLARPVNSRNAFITFEYRKDYTAVSGMELPGSIAVQST